MNRDAFEERLRAAARLERSLRAARRLRRILPGIAVAVAACAILSLLRLPGGGMLLRVVCLAGVGALTLTLSRVAFGKIPRVAAAARLDRALGLPDSALAVVHSSDADPWGRRIAAQEIPRILAAPGMPQSGARPLFVWTGLLAVALLVGLRDSTPPPPQTGAPVPGGAPEPLREILKNWEKIPEEDQMNSPEMRQAMKSLREAIQQRAAGAEEVMVRLARAEDHLEEARQSLEAIKALEALEALRAAAPTLARAFSGIPGQAAAAFARNDFASAAEALRNAARDAQPPSGDSGLDPLAREWGAAGLTALSEALEALSQANTREQAGQAMNQLAEALDAANDPMREEQALKQIGLQISAVREGLSHSEEGAQEAESESGKEGPGAGGEDSAASSGILPELPARIAPIPGLLSEQGASRIEQFSTPGGVRETPSVAPSGAHGAPGDPSSEVVLPESLPAAYREAVRRYFEILRNPSKEP